MDDIERRFARFGARIVMEYWLDKNPDGGCWDVGADALDGIAKECQLMYPTAGSTYAQLLNPLPGIAEAAARLSRPATLDGKLLERTRNTVAELARALGLKVDAGEGE
jgi:hypothetical protein